MRGSMRGRRRRRRRGHGGGHALPEPSSSSEDDPVPEMEEEDDEEVDRDDDEEDEDDTATGETHEDMSSVQSELERARRQREALEVAQARARGLDIAAQRGRAASRQAAAKAAARRKAENSAMERCMELSAALEERDLEIRRLKYENRQLQRGKEVEAEKRSLEARTTRKSLAAMRRSLEAVERAVHERALSSQNHADNVSVLLEALDQHLQHGTHAVPSATARSLLSRLKSSIRDLNVTLQSRDEFMRAKIEVAERASKRSEEEASPFAPGTTTATTTMPYNARQADLQYPAPPPPHTTAAAAAAAAAAHSDDADPASDIDVSALLRAAAKQKKQLNKFRLAIIKARARRKQLKEQLEAERAVSSSLRDQLAEMEMQIRELNFRHDTDQAAVLTMQAEQARMEKIVSDALQERARELLEDPEQQKQQQQQLQPQPEPEPEPQPQPQQLPQRQPPPQHRQLQQPSQRQPQPRRPQLGGAGVQREMSKSVVSSRTSEIVARLQDDVARLDNEIGDISSALRQHANSTTQRIVQQALVDAGLSVSFSSSGTGPLDDRDSHNDDR